MTKTLVHTTQTTEVNQFLGKHHIPYTTTLFEGLAQLQIANGDELLRHQIERNLQMPVYLKVFITMSVRANAKIRLVASPG